MWNSSEDMLPSSRSMGIASMPCTSVEVWRWKGGGRVGGGGEESTAHVKGRHHWHLQLLIRSGVILAPPPLHSLLNTPNRINRLFIPHQLVEQQHLPRVAVQVLPEGADGLQDLYKASILSHNKGRNKHLGRDIGFEI